MSESSGLFSEQDLLFLIRTLMPDCKDKAHMVGVLKEDEDILDGMLSNYKLFESLTGDPESLLDISPQLFFTILLGRVKHDLEHQSHTIEREGRYRMMVFDSKKIAILLNDKIIRRYLIDLLVSFVKIKSFSVSIRIRKGIYRRFRSSDFDIDSLIRLCQTISEERRFQYYKRIADICLFITGVFPDYIDPEFWPLVGGRRFLTMNAPKDRERLTKNGIYFYKLAAQHKAAQIWELNPVLLYLSENFGLAAKPLTFISNRYLRFLKEKLF